MATMPTRIEMDLFEAARAAGALQSRSAAQQLDHWARIGRELEASPGATHDAIARALAGQGGYDELDERAQAIVRAGWREAIEARRATLDLASEFTAAGASWVEADADGNVTVRSPERA